MPKMFPASPILPSEVARLVELVGVPVPELAPRIGCEASTLYRWLRGDTRPNKASIRLLKAIVSGVNVGHLRRTPRFRFIDLFAGIGGMRLALEDPSVAGECAFTCEWNAFSRKTYLANFKDPESHPFIADINAITDMAREIPEHDVLVAGFPCQPFSIAGVSKKNALGQPHGFKCHEQGNLFFKIRDILRVHRPVAFLLENVKNLQSHDGGTTFKVIMRELQQKLGYEVHARVINAKGYVPQNRERIFLVGFRESTDFNFSKLTVMDPQRGPKLRTILHAEDGSEAEEPPYTEGPLAHVAKRYVLTEHLWSYLQMYAAKHRALGHGFGFGLVGPNDTARTLSARYFKDGSEILIDRGRRRRPRRLTPRECARLMGFDRPGHRPFVIPESVSDTQSYKQFGNAVAVPVVTEVAKHMLPHLQRIMKFRDPQLDLLSATEGVALGA